MGWTVFLHASPSAWFPLLARQAQPFHRRKTSASSTQASPICSLQLTWSTYATSSAGGTNARGSHCLWPLRRPSGGCPGEALCLRGGCGGGLPRRMPSALSETERAVGEHLPQSSVACKHEDGHGLNASPCLWLCACALPFTCTRTPCHCPTHASPACTAPIAPREGIMCTGHEFMRTCPCEFGSCPGQAAVCGRLHASSCAKGAEACHPGLTCTRGRYSMSFNKLHLRLCTAWHCCMQVHHTRRGRGLGGAWGPAMQDAHERAPEYKQGTQSACGM